MFNSLDVLDDLVPVSELSNGRTAAVLNKADRAPVIIIKRNKPSYVLMGINDSAGHSHKSYPRTAVGDMYRLVTTQNYMAVTGACLMTKASLYRAFGGLDEEKFAVAYNDVDYCLKLWQKGLLNVYTPRAEAYHYESKSRGLDTLSENAKRYEREKANFYAKYQQYIDNYDPYYNPHFNNLFENFGLK